jgi:hypothetical protein
VSIRRARLPRHPYTEGGGSGGAAGGAGAVYLDASLLEMVSEEDVVFALAATGTPRDRARQIAPRVRAAPEVVRALLEDERLYESLRAEPGLAPPLSPYFVFSVLLRQARRELERRSFLAEWLGPRYRVPLFEAPQVAQALRDPERVQYLAEVLASFARVEAVGDEDPRPAGWPRLRGRFHELDLDRLEALRAEATPEERFLLDRRLAEVALFLAGILPDSARDAPEMDTWEAKSREHYRQAASSSPARRSGLAAILGAMAEELGRVRRALNYLSDRFLHPLARDWFVARA